MSDWLFGQLTRSVFRYVLIVLLCFEQVNWDVFRLFKKV